MMTYNILRTNYHIQPNCNVFGYASKENLEVCVFLFSSFRGTCCTLMPRLLKYMVIRPKCDTIMMAYNILKNKLPRITQLVSYLGMPQKKTPNYAFFCFPAFAAHVAP